MRYLGNQPTLNYEQAYLDRFDYAQASDPTTTTNPEVTNALWINTSTGAIFICTDNTVDANVWKKTVAGASTSTDNAIVRWHSTGGSVAQNSGVIISDTNEISGAGTKINTQVDDYELVLGDAGKTIEMNKGTACTLTIPANASVEFPVGTVINIVQYGAGQVSVAITTDTLVSSGSKRKLTGQYSAASLYKRGSTEWVLIGDIAA